MPAEIFDTNEHLSTKLNSIILQKSTEAIKQKGYFSIALSGGSLAQIFQLSLGSFDVSKWQWFFADERLVPLDSADSNYKTFVEVFKILKVSRENIHTIDEGLIQDPAKAALDYAHKLDNVLKSDPFDVILLGMGPDGHTCSLFPGHSLLESKEKVAYLTDSPKPPPSRITLTFDVVNQAKCSIFVCTGQGKAQVVHEILDRKVDYPAGRVKSGEVWWFLDKPAGSLLQAASSL